MSLTTTPRPGDLPATGTRRRPRPRPGSTTARSGRPTARRPCSSSAARAPSCGTAPATRTSTSSPGSPSSRSATPTPRWPTRSPSRPARCCTCPTCSAPCPGPRWPSPSTGCSAAAARSSSATRGPRPTRPPSSWPGKWGGHGRHVVVSAYGSFHGRTLATLHATGQPAKHEAFQPLPEGFRHVAWNDLDALEAAIDPTVAAVLLEPVQGEGGVNPADGRVLPRASGASATSAASCSWSTRSRPASAAPALVRLPALRRAARRGHDGQGARQRHAHRRVLGPARGRRGVRARRPRHDLRRAAPGHVRGPGRAGRHGARGRSRRSPTGPAPGSPAPLERRSRRSSRSGAWACSWPPSWSTASTPRWWPTPPSPPAWSSTRSPRRRCASPRRCVITDAEIDEAVAILAAVLDRPPRTAGPAGDGA